MAEVMLELSWNYGTDRSGQAGCLICGVLTAYSCGPCGRAVCAVCRPGHELARCVVPKLSSRPRPHARDSHYINLQA